MSQSVHLRKYGVQTTIEFELYEIDGVDLRTNWTPAQSDCEIEKNEGGYTICDNTASGTTTYKIVLTATEMEFARGGLKIVDSATKVFLDKIVYIETYGNASAMHAFDLDTALASQTVGTCTTNTDMVGTDSAALATVLGAAVGASISADIAAVKAETASIQTETTAIDALTKAAGDGDLAAVLTDTNAIQGKLPTNKFMGSSDGADDDGTLNGILTDTAEIGAAGVGLTEAGGDGDHLTAINLPNQTMDIVGNITGNLSGSVGSVTGHTNQTGDNYARLGAPAGASVSADIAAVPTVDEIWAKAMSDLATGAPSATASVLTAINYLYEALRNKTTTTATLVTIKKDDGSTDLMKSTISDDATTFTKGEFVSG